MNTGRGPQTDQTRRSTSEDPRRARERETGLARRGGERRHVRLARGMRRSCGAVQSSSALALPRGDGDGHHHDRGRTVGTFFYSRGRNGRFFPLPPLREEEWKDVLTQETKSEVQPKSKGDDHSKGSIWFLAGAPV